MIETYYRTDKGLTLLRLFGNVTLREQFAAVEELLERAKEPPFPLSLRVLLEHDRQRPVVKKFDAAARMVGNIAFAAFDTETEMLDQIGCPGHSLDSLFPTGCRVAVFGVS